MTIDWIKLTPAKRSSSKEVWINPLFIVTMASFPIHENGTMATHIQLMNGGEWVVTETMEAINRKIKWNSAFTTKGPQKPEDADNEIEFE